MIKKRFHLFEFEDQTWFPVVIREGMMDYLRFMITHLGIYDPVVPLLQEGLEKTGETSITDLCSGGGGGIERVQAKLKTQTGRDIQFTITDKFPNLTAFEYLKKQTNGAVDFIAEPVDATNVPFQISGFRTLFSSFHHFKPEQARAILQDAVNKNAGIGIFEGSGKNYHEILLVWLVFPILTLFITPFIKPFRWSRLFFTYIIPLIPLFTIWDGTVSVLRMYTPERLNDLTASLNADHYVWKTGKATHITGAKVIYLIGYPKPPLTPP